MSTLSVENGLIEEPVIKTPAAPQALVKGGKGNEEMGDQERHGHTVILYSPQKWKL